MFTKLCGFGWMIGDAVPLVFDEHAEIYNRHGINFGALVDLESIGLVQFNGITEFQRKKLPKEFDVLYYGKPLRLQMPDDADNTLAIGKTILTKIGYQLAPICGSKPVDGFYEYVKSQWSQYLRNDGNKEQL